MWSLWTLDILWCFKAETKFKAQDESCGQMPYIHSSRARCLIYLGPPNTLACRFSWILYFALNVHSGELDVCLAGCSKGKGWAVYASVDATGTQTICGWFLPFLAAFLSWRMKAATLSHLVATKFYFWNVS